MPGSSRDGAEVPITGHVLDVERGWNYEVGSLAPLNLILTESATRFLDRGALGLIAWSVPNT